MANAADTKRKNWIASDDRAQEIIDFVFHYDADGEGFFSAVKKGVDQYGKPTDNMRNAMVKMIDKRAAQKAEWATRDGKCEFVGTVGERQAFALTVKHVVEMESMYGWTWLHICRDADENVIIYKGSQDWGKGAQVTCMAKVKEHGVRDGVKQTIIQRPTKVKLNGEDY
jgi:hypothetical protein|tara:strand:+ start:493 stop:999 length:507 start_codon:yes stop_codon:yes gene_type:complete